MLTKHWRWVFRGVPDVWPSPQVAAAVWLCLTMLAAALVLAVALPGTPVQKQCRYPGAAVVPGTPMQQHCRYPGAVVVPLCPSAAALPGTPVQQRCLVPRSSSGAPVSRCSSTAGTPVQQWCLVRWYSSSGFCSSGCNSQNSTRELGSSYFYCWMYDYSAHRSVPALLHLKQTL